MPRGFPILVVCVLASAIPAAARAADLGAAELEFFEKKIRPVLAEQCQGCHGGIKKKGNLQLTSRAALLKGGDTGPAAVPGDPEKSLLIKALRYQDDLLRMPPKSKLADDRIADFVTWVKMGLPWPAEPGSRPDAKSVATNSVLERRSHWSFQPLRPTAPPRVRRGDWVRSPVDAFILAGLEGQGLTPAPAADRRTLLRRVTFDLTGLPPTPAEIEAFLADRSPDAFAKVVERLLAAPAYGERWGRHWLDLVRYAETCGHEFDFDLPDAYRYRDYVIRAFNADLPYDQFMTEHVAGDLLPRPRRNPADGSNESILGTGFWFLGEAAHSPVDVRKDEADRIDNQLDVFSKTFLGLTVACARCHDHKFDPITAKDYYALSGFLQSSRFQLAYLDRPPGLTAGVERLRALQGKCRPLAVTATAAALQHRVAAITDLPFSRDALPRWNELAVRVREQQGRYVSFVDFDRDGYRDWFVSGEAFGDRPGRTGDVILDPNAAPPVKQVLERATAHSGRLSGRLQGVLRSRTFVITKKHVLYHVAGRGGVINLIIDGYQLIRDPIYGGLRVAINHGDRPAWRVQDVSMWLGHKAYVEIIDDGEGYVALDRVLFSDDGPPEETPNGLLCRLLKDSEVQSRQDRVRRYRELLREIIEQWEAGTLPAAADAGDRMALLNGLLRQGEHRAGERETGSDDWTAVRAEYRNMESGLPAHQRALALTDGTPWDERVHIRGNPHNLGELVPRRFLEVLGGDQSPTPPRDCGRVELARRLVSDANPLLPRVMVNRIWQHHFGEGLVRSPDNFGVLGERPTHPELLDYLAAEFIRSGWSVKQMHRLMLLSNTYQMASQTADPMAGQRDPQNRLRHRMPVRRLEAEAIRDAILAVSGRLDRTLYGPGVPPHLTPHMSGRGRPTQSGPLDGAGRRSIYLAVRRNFLTPLFLAFDYPIPFTTMGRRTASNVPAQALALMNNPFVVQQAEIWAGRVLRETGRSPAERVERLYREAFGRPPQADELAEALRFLEEQRKVYGDSAPERAWVDLCHVLFNVKEFIFIN